MALSDDLSHAYTQLKGTRKGETYRVRRGQSGAAVRVYNQSATDPRAKRDTALVPGSKPAKAPTSVTGRWGRPGSGPAASETTAKSKAHGGESWVYRRGASGKLIPVRKAG